MGLPGQGFNYMKAGEALQLTTQIKNVAAG